jgi:hypothetical protein
VVVLLFSVDHSGGFWWHRWFRWRLRVMVAAAAV